MNQQRAVFVTGTDTGVGKTVVSALLCKTFAAGYWKPIQSGTVDGTDRDTVADLANLPASHFYPETYSLREPLSPHAAAKLEGIEIDPAQIKLPSFKQNLLVVEGAGGVLVPINRSYLMIDLISDLSLPTIVVARSTLGTINHTLLTLQALRSRAIDVLGVVLNGPRNAGNAEAIEFYGRTRILAQIEMMPFNELANKNYLSNLAPFYANENSGRPAAGAAR